MDNADEESDSRGISEGMGDYFAIDYRRLLQPSNPFRPNHRRNWFWNDSWDALCIKPPADARYPEPDKGGHWGLSPYSKMPVWASTLMDMEYVDATNPSAGTRLGRDVTVRLMLTSLSYLTSSASVQDYMWAIFQADRDIPEYKGMHLNTLMEIFKNRGFFYYNQVSGNITTNTTWSQPMLVTGDVTINSGVTLTIKPNSTRFGQTFVFFEPTDDRAGGTNPSKCELIVNGTLKADSTTFTGPSKGSWYGIRFTSSGTNNSYLKKCTIRNAMYAVDIDSKSPYIHMCFIDDASGYGIYIRGSSAWPMITQNYIEGDVASVYHDNGGNGYFTNNSFRNSQYGVYVNSGSPAYDYYNVGRNKFESSISLDKTRVQAGLPILKTYQYFTIPNSGYKYIRNYTANTIQATSNYWSAYPPSDSYFYGSVDRSNPLSSPPSNPPAGPSWTLPKALEEDFWVAFDQARMLFYDGKYALAKDRFKALVEKHGAGAWGAYALNWYMFSSEQMGELEREKEYLKSLRIDKKLHENTRFYALKWLVQLELRQGSVEEALRLSKEVAGGTLYEREILIDLAEGLYYYRGDREKAEEVLTQLSGKFKEEHTLEAIGMIRNGFVREMMPERLAKEVVESGVESPELSAFPTPFNIETKIRFKTLESGHVRIVIYNILGQEIVRLLDKEMEAGMHEVSWNGEDGSGNVVPSGVYLCRFESPKISKSIKLVMTK